MSIFKKLILFVSLLLCPVATAGEFTFTYDDSSGVWYDYTGIVEAEDADQLRGIMKTWPTRNVFITIDSGGGDAFGGLALFWEAERWDNLTTIAGKDLGAWSAAAMFWLGSPRDWHESEESKVGFHQAYCNPWRPPGCDLTIFRERLVECFNKAGYHGTLFDAHLTATQQTWGVGGWAVLTDEGWLFHHTGFNVSYKIIPIWEI